MISREVMNLFENNRSSMKANDQPHLSSQQLPDNVKRDKDISYIDGKDSREETMLDIYRPSEDADTLMPVVIDFHGGGLYYGNKENNECRDMLFAAQGFAVVNANFPLVPEVSVPTQMRTAIQVLHWVSGHGSEYGLDTNRVCLTGDSAGGALALYLAAANGSPQVAQSLGLTPAGFDIRAMTVTSGMFRLEGGVHATALSYYGQGYFQTPADRITMTPYLDLDKLVVDAGEGLAPIYMVTSAEDFIADNTLELARILHRRHRDYGLKVWPMGMERQLAHVFNVVQAGDPTAVEAREVIADMADFCRRYLG